MKQLLAILLFSILTLSCSSNDEESNNNSSINFTLNKGYIQKNATVGNVCYSDIIFTDGSLYETTDEIRANNNVKNIIFFNDVRINNCQLNSNSEWIWDLSNTSDPNLGMEGTNPVINISLNNGVLVSATDLTEKVIYAKLNFTLPNNYTFIIKLNDGRIIQNIFSNQLNQLSQYKDIVWD
jgi:hypothetical protein